MRYPKQTTPITEGINRRFFAAIEALVAAGKLKSLSAFCTEFDLYSPRYREMRLTYGITPKPEYKSRYINIEMDALYHICNTYYISAEWLLTGKGEMLKK